MVGGPDRSGQRRHMKVARAPDHDDDVDNNSNSNIYDDAAQLEDANRALRDITRIIIRHGQPWKDLSVRKEHLVCFFPQCRPASCAMAGHEVDMC